MRPLTKVALYGGVIAVVAIACLYWVGGDDHTNQVDLVINAPPQTVFKHLTEPELVKGWATDVVSIEPITNDGHQVGAQARMIIEHDGKQLEFVDEVIKSDLDSHLIVVSNSSVFQNNADYSLIAPNQNTTNLRLINKIQFKGFYRFMGPFAGSAESKLKENMERLKLAAEKDFDENGSMAKKQTNQKEESRQDDRKQGDRKKPEGDDSSK